MFSGMKYESYTDFYRIMDEVSHAKHKACLIKDFLPLTGMTDKLKSGATALDVGCGSGFHIFQFGNNFILGDIFRRFLIVNLKRHFYLLKIGSLKAIFHISMHSYLLSQIIRWCIKCELLIAAEHFPNTNFTGIDVSLDAVKAATQNLSTEGKGLHNAAFIQMDARKLSDDWTEKFDWVSIFDACHDQQRPDLVSV